MRTQAHGNPGRGCPEWRERRQERKARMCVWSSEGHRGSTAGMCKPHLQLCGVGELTATGECSWSRALSELTVLDARAEDGSGSQGGPVLRATALPSLVSLEPFLPPCPP